MATHRPKWYTLVGVLLLPLAMAVGLLAATWNLNDRLGTVQAAIVNNDEAVTVNGQYVPLGRQLTAALIDSDREQNFDWVLASEQDAADGLADGTYAAVVTIPKNFSAAATSMSGDPDLVQQATIRVETSEVGGLAETSLGQSVAKEAVATLNSTLTETFVDQIYVGFEQVGKSFTDLKTGTRQLADGAKSLSEGISQAAAGSGELTTGLETLSSSGSQLTSGAEQLATGAGQLSSGLSQLKQGTAQLPGQTSQLASGTKQYVDGVDQIIDSSRQQLGSVGELSAGAKKLSGGLSELQSGLQGLAASAGAGGTTPTMPCPDQIVAAYGAAGCAGFYAGVQTGAGAALQGLGDQVDANGEKTPGLVTGMQSLADGIPVPSESEKQQTLAGLDRLEQAGRQLTTGTSQLSAGMPQLTSGISQAASGASQLATGADQFSAGLGTYVDGVGQAATGSRALTTGLDAAAEGAKQLSEGTGDLADGVAEGAKEIPSYTEAQRKSLADVVSSPVSDADTLGLPQPAVAWSSLVLVIGLWIGALALYVVTTAVRRGIAMSTASSVRVFAASLAPGLIVAAIQAGLLSVVASLFGVPGGLSLFGMLLLASVTFVVLHFALTSLFGNIGRWVSAGFAIVAVAVSVTAAVPGWLGLLRPISPLSPALEGIRDVMTSQSPMNAVLGLSGWLVLGLLGCTAAVIRSRKVPVAEVLSVR